MNNKQNLKKQIKLKELQIKKIQLHPISPNNREYNSLILEKAILKKELADLGKNQFAEKIKSFFNKREKLICDYFKN